MYEIPKVLVQYYLITSLYQSNMFVLKSGRRTFVMQEKEKCVHDLKSPVHTPFTVLMSFQSILQRTSHDSKSVLILFIAAYIIVVISEGNNLIRVHENGH